MSGGAAHIAGDPPQPQHRLLTFGAVWRRTQTMLFYGAAVMLIGTAVTYADDHKLDLEFLLLGLLLLVFGLAYLFGARRYYVQVTEGGLVLNGLRRHALIPFADIRQVRCQPLQVLFAAANRKGLMVRSLRQFERSPACVIRLDLEPEQVTRLGKSAGRGCAVDQDLILVVADAKELERSLRSRVRRRPPAPASHRR
ncbi:MAG: hypothetical protein WBA31_03190 [Candidatus Dormiibacterota bacterium]